MTKIVPVIKMVTIYPTSIMGSSCMQQGYKMAKSLLVNSHVALLLPGRIRNNISTTIMERKVENRFLGLSYDCHMWPLLDIEVF